MSPNSEVYNADELEAPEWLNKEFIKEVLVQHLKVSTMEVVDLKLCPASKKGDHYASLMFRAVAQYKTPSESSSISLIIKTAPEQEGVKKDMLDESHVFETEIEMYTKVLPKFQSILRQIGDETTFYTPCIYHRMKPRPIMIFEDLVTMGYSVLRRSANEEEIRSALTKLAKWHAVSHKLLKEQPEELEHLKYDITTLPNFLTQPFMTKSFKCFLDMLSRRETLKPYIKYFEPMDGKIIQRYVDASREYHVNRQENGLYGLCHGDFHLKNLMFKGTDCLLLDFQLANVGPLSNDIIYAIYMLFEGDLQKYKVDELVYFYFQVFLETLKKIGFQHKLPTLNELRQEMFRRRYFDIMVFTAYQPLIMGMRKGADAGEVVEDDEAFENLYKQEEYIDYVEHVLPGMLHHGYFDPL